MAQMLTGLNEFINSWNPFHRGWGEMRGSVMGSFREQVASLLSRRAPQVKSEELAFDTMVVLNLSQMEKLHIKMTGESTLAWYVDSTFEMIPIGDYFFVTRRRKGEVYPQDELFDQLSARMVAGDNHEDEHDRTVLFCLEIQSGFEEILQSLAEQGDNRSIYLVKRLHALVNHFLSQNQLSSANYISLLIMIIEHIPDTELRQMDPIIERHKRILELPYFPRNRAPSKWAIVSTFVKCSNLLRRDGPFPLLPAEQTIINRYSLLGTGELIAQSHREIGRWLAEHIQVITFKELCQSIEHSCISLHGEIRTWDNYNIVTVKGKSQAWMADIAYSYLPADKMPTAVRAFVHRAGGFFQSLEKGDTDHFLFFDDAVYSGKQLEEYLEDLRRDLIDKNERYASVKTIHVIVGFAPKATLEKLQAYADELAPFQVNVTIQAARISPTIGEMLETEGRSGEFIKKVGRIVQMNKPLMTTQWKTPDWFSLPQFFSNGFIPLHIVRKDISLEKTLFRKPPVLQVEPPYKKPFHQG